MGGKRAKSRNNTTGMSEYTVKIDGKTAGVISTVTPMSTNEIELAKILFATIENASVTRVDILIKHYA